jgi:hypothetical protein
VFRLWSYRSSKFEDLAPIQVEFSLARYEPMARLMSEEDYLFLKAQPGFRPQTGKKFMRERRRIFRLYLEELAGDFHRLHAQARLIVAGLPADHAPLIGMLLRQQVRFWYEMSAVELRLSFPWMGTGSIHARGLIDALATMHAEISRVPVAA